MPSPPKRRNIENVFHVKFFSNKLAGRKRPTDISEWTEDSLINYRSLGIRATSPAKRDFDCGWGADEVFEEVRLTKDICDKEKLIINNIYECLVFSGNTSVRLIDRFKESKLTIADVDEDIIDFARTRIKKTHRKYKDNLQTYISGYSDRFYPKDKKYDLIICHKKINMKMDLNSFLKESQNHLNENGLISLSFWNKASMQAIGWKFLEARNLRNVLCFNEGPFDPVSAKEVLATVAKNEYEVISDYGLGLLSPYRNRYLHNFSTKNRLIKRHSRTRLLIIRLKKVSN